MEKEVPEQPFHERGKGDAGISAWVSTVVPAKYGKEGTVGVEDQGGYAGVSTCGYVCGYAGEGGREQGAAFTEYPAPGGIGVQIPAGGADTVPFPVKEDPFNLRRVPSPHLPPAPFPPFPEADQ
jgi:hypothetical protein